MVSFTQEQKVNQNKDLDNIKKLKDGERCYFNMFQDGGAVCYRCNGMYVLFSIPLYGGEEAYEKTFYEEQINEMIELAYTWT